MVPAIVLLVALLGSVCGVCGYDPSAHNVVWTTPTAEPATNQEGAPVIAGGMPLGNGDTAALVFPINTTAWMTPVSPGVGTPFLQNASLNFFVSK